MPIEPARLEMLSALARETSLGKGTVHRLLNALIDAGLAFQDQETKRYRLGAGLALLGHAAHRQDFAALAKPFLLRLAEQTQDTVYASVREGGAAVCVAREIGAFPIRTLSLEVGRARMSVRELLQLAPGAIVELDRASTEPLDVLVNGVRIARGEVVVVNDKFGIRLTDVVSATERMEQAR